MNCLILEMKIKNVLTDGLVWFVETLSAAAGGQEVGGGGSDSEAASSHNSGEPRRRIKHHEDSAAEDKSGHQRKWKSQKLTLEHELDRVRRGNVSVKNAAAAVADRSPKLEARGKTPETAAAAVENQSRHTRRREEARPPSVEKEEGRSRQKSVSSSSAVTTAERHMETTTAAAMVDDPTKRERRNSGRHSVLSHAPATRGQLLRKVHEVGSSALFSTLERTNPPSPPPPPTPPVLSVKRAILQ
jgi:hypothetical protein